MPFETQPASAEQTTFREELLARGLLIDCGVPGLYGHGAAFEDLRVRFDALVTRATAEDDPEMMRFPPLLAREQLEASGYLDSFPHLAGSVFAFDEADEQERERASKPWGELARRTELALVPAACYPVYPAVARRGPLARGGVAVDAGGAAVFRHEPSDDPARWQLFHQRELVRIGAPEDVGAWRERWRERGLALLRGLGLAAELDRAADPFFGRAGRMLAANQLSQELKHELLVPIAGAQPTAVSSFNYHGEHFAGIHGLVFADGGEVHTACVGFGQERIVLALLRAHGFDTKLWPAEVRRQLWDS
jgi:seryl-tRNA synthetase